MPTAITYDDLLAAICPRTGFSPADVERISRAAAAAYLAGECTASEAAAVIQFASACCQQSLAQSLVNDCLARAGAGRGYAGMSLDEQTNQLLMFSDAFAGGALLIAGRRTPERQPPYGQPQNREIPHPLRHHRQRRNPTDSRQAASVRSHRRS